MGERKEKVQTFPWGKGKWSSNKKQQTKATLMEGRSNQGGRKKEEGDIAFEAF